VLENVSTVHILIPDPDHNNFTSRVLNKIGVQKYTSFFVAVSGFKEKVKTVANFLIRKQLKAEINTVLDNLKKCARSGIFDPEKHR
jgi:hypothetical protein